jgi:hypothetical protein
MSLIENLVYKWIFTGQFRFPISCVNIYSYFLGLIFLDCLFFSSAPWVGYVIFPVVSCSTPAAELPESLRPLQLRLHGASLGPYVIACLTIIAFGYLFRILKCCTASAPLIPEIGVTRIEFKSMERHSETLCFRKIGSLSEMRVFQALNEESSSPLIVRYFGYDPETSEIHTEHMMNGSVFEYLQANPTPLSVRLVWALDIC